MTGTNQPVILYCFTGIFLLLSLLSLTHSLLHVSRVVQKKACSLTHSLTHTINSTRSSLHTPRSVCVCLSLARSLALCVSRGTLSATVCMHACMATCRYISLSQTKPQSWGLGSKKKIPTHALWILFGHTFASLESYSESSESSGALGRRA